MSYKNMFFHCLKENNDDKIRHKLLKIKDETIINLTSFEKKTDNSKFFLIRLITLKKKLKMKN